jgi:hypothetical protein
VAYLKRRKEFGAKPLPKFGKFKHFFTTKNNIVKIAKKYGLKEVDFFDHPTRNYLNSDYRFNVILKK